MIELNGDLAFYPWNKRDEVPDLTTCLERFEVHIPIDVPKEVETKLWDACKQHSVISVYDDFIEEFIDVKSEINNWCKDNGVPYITDKYFKYLWNGKFWRNQVD